MGGWPGGYESRVSLKLGVSREAVKGTLAGDENCSLPHIAQSTQSSPKASPFPKATGSDVSLSLILKNSPVLTSSSSWTFFYSSDSSQGLCFSVCLECCPPKPLQSSPFFTPMSHLLAKPPLDTQSELVPVNSP